MDLFHLSGGCLGAGSIVEPGNWGRVLRAHGWNHAQAFREMALESARVSRFSHCPSRLESGFAFVRLDDARAFQQTVNGFRTHILYRVRLTDRDAATGITDWELCEANGIMRHDWADAYWLAMKLLPNSEADVGGTGLEVLALSPMRIEERLDP